MTDTILNPYLNFKDGQAKEAMEFYQSVFGGKLEVSTFGDTPGVPGAEKNPDLIMHASLENDSLRIMGSDAIPDSQFTAGTNVSLSLSGTDEAELTKYFEGLSAGGNVVEPLKKAPWGDTFGMLDDKYGIHWLVNITAAK